jgi:putative SOS response-associated peptidase YedK
MAPVIVSQSEVVLKDMRWGLIPFWARGEEIGNRTINARAETVKEKPSFRTSLKRKRCLVLAHFLLRMAEDPRQHAQTAHVHSDQRPGALCLCRAVGHLEEA